MKAVYGVGKTACGPGVSITLDGNELATAIDAYLVANRISVTGLRTVTVNGQRCLSAHMYVDPSGHVNTVDGTLIGSGPIPEPPAV